jgi:predicted lipase
MACLSRVIYYLDDNTPLSKLNNFYIQEEIEFLIKQYIKLLHFISDSETDTQVGVFFDNIKIIIAFRGTSSITDLLFFMEQFNTKKLTTKDTKLSNEEPLVHSGFFNHLNGVKNILYKIIDKYNNYELHLTGHSLGGAVATLFAFLVSEKYNEKKINLVTFGSPRVGDSKWKTCFNNKKNIIYYRITNNRDIITVLPIWNYHHVGKHIYLDNKGLKYIDDTLIFKHSFSDHVLFHYYKNIKQTNKTYFTKIGGGK